MSEVSLAPGWRSAMAEPPPSRQSARTQPSSLSSSPSSAAVRPVLTEDWLPSISYRTTVPSLLTPMALRARREDAASMPEVVTVLSSMSSLPPTAYSTSLHAGSAAVMESVTSSPTGKSTHEGTFAPSDLVSTIWFSPMAKEPVPLLTTLSLTEPPALTGVESSRSSTI